MVHCIGGLMKKLYRLIYAILKNDEIISVIADRSVHYGEMPEDCEVTYNKGDGDIPVDIIVTMVNHHLGYPLIYQQHAVEVDIGDADGVSVDEYREYCKDNGIISEV